MSTATPEPSVYAAVPPARPWFKKKRFVLPALAVVFFAMGASTGGGDSAPTATPTPAVTVTVPGPAPAAEVEVVTKTVNKDVTPAACITALDLTVRVMDAVAAEHASFGVAATKGGKDGDVSTFLASVTKAITTMNATVTDVTPDMGPAAAACRAAS